MTLELLKFWVVKPTKTADTNLCTNPSFETGTTGWTTGGSNTIATSAAVAYRGVYSCKCTYTDNDLFASYAITLTDVDHTASMDIYIPTAYEGTQLTLTWTGYTSGTIVTGLADMTIKDAWQRVHAHINPDAGDLAGTLTLSETGTNGDATEFIYIDGVLIEARNEPTTYFDGDTDEYCYWNGQQNASTSVRKANSRRGGTLVELDDYMCINSIIGLGINPYMINKTQTAGGRSLYQRTNKLDREFLLIGEIISDNYDELQTKRKALQELFQPDYVTGEQEVTLRYMATTAAGLQASEVVEIRCRMKSDGLIGHWSKPTQEPITLMFEAYDDLTREGNAAVALDYNDTLADADYIVKQDRDGVWSAMAGYIGTVLAIAQHPITKVIYAAGMGQNIGGDGDADYLAMWNGTAWVAVVAGCNGQINALAFDAAGNLYIGGAFTDWGDASGDRIVKWDGSSLSSLGTGLGNNSCYGISIDKTGNVYAVGNFTSAGGVASTAYIAMWNGTTWATVGGGLANSALGIVSDKFGNIYVASSDVFKWDGSSWTDLNFPFAASQSGINCLAVDESNNLYAAGPASAGGTDLSAFSVYNNKWTDLSSTIDAAIYNMIINNNKVYIGGFFTKAGSVDLLDKVAVYIGNNIYKPLDINLPGNPTVYTLFTDEQQNLYLGYSTTGDAETAGDDTITNPGTSTRPKITITAPGLLRQIVNTTNNKGVYFNNLTLLAGEVVTLDFEKQTFTSTFRGNILSYILEGISTLDFTLEPGVNRIATFIDGTTSAATNATMEYKIRYWSLDEANR